MIGLEGLLPLPLDLINGPLDTVPLPLLYIIWFEQSRGKVAPAPVCDTYDGWSRV